MIDRRDFFGVVCLLAAATSTASAQKAGKMPVIGLLGSSAPEHLAKALSALRTALEESGFVEGKSLEIEYRWADNRYDALAQYAVDLVKRPVDLIIASGGGVTANVAKSSTKTIPIVFTGVSDPVGLGLVASLGRPGGNLTGSSILGIELDGKRLELLHTILPEQAVMGAIMNPRLPQRAAQRAALEAAAASVGRTLTIVETGSSNSEIAAAFDALVRAGVKGLVVAADPSFIQQGPVIAALASQHAIAAMYQWRSFVETGGLMSYGPSLETAYRHAGLYAGRILKGEKAADLPVVQSARIELLVNLKTARALGITLPPSILLRADEVIE